MANLQLVGNIAGSEAATVKLTVTYLSDYRDEQGRLPPPVLMFQKQPGQEWTAQPGGGAAIVLGPDQIGIPAPRVSVTYSLVRAGLPPLARTLERYIVPNTHPDGFWDFTRPDGNGAYNGSPENLTQVNVLPGQGPQGNPGPGVLMGFGAPAQSLGMNGDTYLNTVTWDVYARGGGAWVLQGNIRGGQGGQGGPGAQGLPGVDGKSFPVPTSSQEGFLPVADGSQPSGFSWMNQNAMKLRKLGDVDVTGIQNGQTLVWSSDRNRFVPGDASSGGGPVGPTIDPIAGEIINWGQDTPNWAVSGALKKYGFGDDVAFTEVWGYSSNTALEDTTLSITYSNNFTEALTYQPAGPWIGPKYWQFVQPYDPAKPSILINVARGVYLSSVTEAAGTGEPENITYPATNPYSDGFAKQVFANLPNHSLTNIRTDTPLDASWSVTLPISTRMLLRTGPSSGVTLWRSDNTQVLSETNVLETGARTAILTTLLPSGRYYVTTTGRTTETTLGVNFVKTEIPAEPAPTPVTTTLPLTAWSGAGWNIENVGGNDYFLAYWGNAHSAPATAVVALQAGGYVDLTYGHGLQGATLTIGMYTSDGVLVGSTIVKTGSTQGTISSRLPAAPVAGNYTVKLTMTGGSDNIAETFIRPSTYTNVAPTPYPLLDMKVMANDWAFSLGDAGLQTWATGQQGWSAIGTLLAGETFQIDASSGTTIILQSPQGSFLSQRETVQDGVVTLDAVLQGGLYTLLVGGGSWIRNPHIVNPVVQAGDPTTPAVVGGQVGGPVMDLTNFDLTFQGATFNQTTASFALAEGTYNITASCPGATAENPVRIMLDYQLEGQTNWTGFLSATITDTDMYSDGPVHADAWLVRVRAYCAVAGTFTAHASVTLE